MSRYPITVTRQRRFDPDAVIGYDPPLRTYFLQAFPHQETDEPALWLGTYDHTLETHEDLHHAAIAHGYDFMPLPDVAAQLATDKAQEAGRPPHTVLCPRSCDGCNPNSRQRKRTASDNGAGSVLFLAKPELDTQVSTALPGKSR